MSDLDDRVSDFKGIVGTTKDQGQLLDIIIRLAILEGRELQMKERLKELDDGE
jgi:hypothetical protein